VLNTALLVCPANLTRNKTTIFLVRYDDRPDVLGTLYSTGVFHPSGELRKPNKNRFWDIFIIPLNLQRFGNAGGILNFTHILHTFCLAGEPDSLLTVY